MLKNNKYVKYGDVHSTYILYVQWSGIIVQGVYVCVCVCVWGGGVRSQSQWGLLQVCNPPAGGVRYVQLGELILQQSRDDSVKGRPEIDKQDPGAGWQRSPGAAGCKFPF